MTHPLFAQLAPHRRRRRRRAAVAGLFAGLAAAVLVGGGLRLAGFRTPGLVAFLTLPAVGAAVGLLRRQRWPHLAADLDRAAGLDDHLTSAVEFAALPARTPVHDLQLADAGRRLEAAPPNLLPVRPPHGWLAVAAVYLLAGGLWLGNTRPAQADPPPPHVLEAAATLQKLADEIDADADAEQAPELKQLAAELRQAAEALRTPGCDEATAQKTLAGIQDQTAAKQSAESAAAKDEAGLKAAGEAMTAAAPLKPAGTALQKSQFAKAAAALAGVPGNKFEPKDARAGADSLAAAADKLGADGLPELGKPCRRLAQGAAGDLDQLRQGCDELARKAQEQDRRQRLSLLTARYQRLLTECKKQIERRNLLEQKANPNAAVQPVPSVPTEADLARQMANPQFRAKIEAILKKFDPDGTGEQDDGPGRDPADGPPDPAAPRQSSPRDRLRNFEAKLEEALQRERVPVEYYEAVRNYFRRMAKLEADAGKP